MFISVIRSRLYKCIFTMPKYKTTTTKMLKSIKKKHLSNM